jgi:hypothetical protein
MTKGELIFRVNGIPLPQPKENNRGGVVYHRDKPMRLRHPLTGRLVPAGEDILEIPWPYDVVPQTEVRGKYHWQIKPRKFWRALIRLAALTAAGGACPVYPKGTPLLYGAVFYMPRPLLCKTFWQFGSDVDNYNYTIWNALKKDRRAPHGYAYYDDDQIQFTRWGGRIYARPEDGIYPGAIIWLTPLDLSEQVVRDKVALYEARLKQDEEVRNGL